MAYTRRKFAKRVLKRLGDRPSDGAVQGLIGWERAEGGHFNNTARYNPLNTTQPAPGAGNTGTQGNIKVYRSPGQGVRATVKTLENGNYGGILRALKAGDPSRLASAIDASPWGTHGSLVYNAINSAPKHAGGPGRATGGTGGRRVTTTTTSTPTVNGTDRRAALLNYVENRDNPDALLNLAVGLRDAVQQVPVTKETVGPVIGGQQAGGGRKLNKIQRVADRIDAHHYPYQWGGGHNPSTQHQAIPLDCSGAVSKVLGLDPRVASQFEGFGRRGEGKHVTIYAKDTHVLMKINGRFWGTSGSNPGGGAGWIPASAISPSYLSGFTVRHPKGL